MSISRISDSSYLYGLLGVQSVNQTQSGVSAASLLSADSSESDQVKVSGLGASLSKLRSLLTSDPDTFKDVTAKISEDLTAQAEATDDERKSQMLTDMAARFAEASESGTMEALQPSAPPPPPPAMRSAASDETETDEDSTTTAAEDSTATTAAASLAELLGIDDETLTAEDLESLFGMTPPPPPPPGPRPTAATGAESAESAEATASTDETASTATASAQSTDETETQEELLRKALASRAAMRQAIGQYARDSLASSSAEAESDLMDVFASINQLIASDLAEATGGQASSADLAA